MSENDEQENPSPSPTETEDEPLPPPSTDTIISLLQSTDRFEESSIPIFESYIRHAFLEEKKWNLEVLLALVKLYQLYPSTVEESLNTLELCLGLSLMHLDEQAFSLALFMIPEQVQSIESISKLCELAEQLESAQFALFWNKLTESKPIIDQIPDFENTVRSFITGILTKACKTVTKTFLGESVGLQGKPLSEWIKQNNWKEEGQIVHFPKGLSPSGKQADNVNYDYLKQILQALK